MKSNTRKREVWIWTGRHLNRELKGDLEQIRIEVAGEVLLKWFGGGNDPSTVQRWFDAAADIDDSIEAWLFDDQCLTDDGWIRTQSKNSIKGNGWKHR